MKLYKFRQLTSSKDLERIIEILKTNQFHCAKFFEMNDPMEGVYISRDLSKVKKIFDEKNMRRICSFSSEKGFKNNAMWGYYTNGFKGVSIEIEVEENKVKEVLYKSRIPKTSNVEIILTTKLKDWKHEAEYRFITENNENKCKVGEITKVYFGSPYENLINTDDIIPKSEQILNYNKYREKLEIFLKENKIEFENIKII
ncbi:hypothetical protein [Aliarcobacter butzleri]|uniref:hypothetical protein n=1 Tax=Aliarcobacter butzleri TaxID=28197 RepID=UPI00263F37A5|nr:hypothetical protein [Aliarcobacter butzleri]MDN5048577.1 hypothetical protein [Aliarcobacter butzleri]MDN5056679.1 hypothetical protein [Aliarcobacter butzleri]